MMRLTGMPRRAQAARSWEVARMAIPRRVRITSHCSPSMRAAAAAQTSTWVRVIVTWPHCQRTDGHSPGNLRSVAP